ncbi:MAG: PilI type IV pilus biogenesis protein, partial [Parvibaculum sp.]|nr:PilI type IV pilus biogenesis protein [Parvibaculum sp.]
RHCHSPWFCIPAFKGPELYMRLRGPAHTCLIVSRHVRLQRRAACAPGAFCTWSGPCPAGNEPLACRANSPHSDEKALCSRDLAVYVASA